MVLKNISLPSESFEENEKVYLASDTGTCVFSSKIPYFVGQTADT